MTAPDRAIGPRVGRVVVLGHSGFIGTHVTEALHAARDVEVVGSSLPDVDLSQWSQASTLKPHFTPDTAVVLCAAIKRQLGDSVETFEQNTAITANICRLLEQAPVARLLYFSSAAVYGEDTHNVAIDEDAPIDLTSWYGINKYASERLLMRATRGGPTRVVSLRPPLVYGPGDQALYGPSGFLGAALAGRPIVLWGPGTERREFRYVGDVAAVVAGLVHHTFAGPLNLTRGVPETFRETADLVRALVPGTSIEVRERTRPAIDHVFVGGRLGGLLPGVRFTPLDEGLRLTLEYERSKRERAS